MNGDSDIKMKSCVIYKRTSSLTNCGDDKDSHKRQEQICVDYCKSNNLSIQGVFYDAGVSGKVSVFNRKGFYGLYLHCLENDITRVVFESISRFSRDLYELEVAYRKLTSDGIQLISVTDGDFEDDRISTLNRQIISAISEYQRKEIVFNLSVARDRKKSSNKESGYVTLNGKGKCEGRKTHKEMNAELVALVKKLRRKNWKTKKVMSYQKISDYLYSQGYVNERGNQYDAKSISRMVEQ